MSTNALSNVPLFANLDETELSLIASRAVTRTYPRNSVLINEGDQTDSLYVILSGQVKVYAGDEDGRELLLTLLGPNEYFGELAIIDEEPRSASVMTTEPCKLAIISKEDFLHCLATHPAIAINVLKVLARRLRQQTENTKSLALMGVYERVAKTLLEQAIPLGNEQVVEGLTQKHLAAMVGASREMISLVFKELKAGGYVTVQRGRVIIHKKLPAKW